MLGCGGGTVNGQQHGGIADLDVLPAFKRIKVAFGHSRTSNRIAVLSVRAGSQTNARVSFLLNTPKQGSARPCEKSLA